MDFDPAELDTLSREDLILRARARGVQRPEQMTRVELRDEIVRLSEPDLDRQRRTRGWLGVARDLLASVVESGLNLPDAAAAIRGDGKSLHEFQGPPPVATVTLAEIYAAQGHYEQALTMLDEVIAREPEHATARKLRERIAEERDLGPGRRRKVVETRAESLSTPQPPAVAPKGEPPPEVGTPVAPEPAAAAPVSAEPAPVAPEPAAAAPVSAEPGPADQAAHAPEQLAQGGAAAPAPVERAQEVPAAPIVAQAEVLATPAAAEPAIGDTEPAGQHQPALLVLQTAERAFVYWRLPDVQDSLRLRSVTVDPSEQEPEIAQEDFALPARVGGFWLSRHARGAQVRAALGVLSSDGFVPLSVARVIDESDDTLESQVVELDADLEQAARVAAGL